MPIIKYSKNVILEPMNPSAMVGNKTTGKYKAISTRYGKKRTLCTNCTWDKIVKQQLAIKRMYNGRG